MSDTAVQSKVFVEDMSLATGGTGAAETGPRRTSTGGVSTLTKFDATHIKYRSCLQSIENSASSAYVCLTEAQISAAITAIGSTIATIKLLTGSTAITDDLTIPTNITLAPEPGAYLTIATTKTLTINGHVDAGLYQIFSCTGTGKVVYAGKKYPEWWGAKDDSGTTACAAAFNAACLNAGPVEVVNPNGGYYDVATAIVLPSNTTLYGRGYQSRIHSSNITRLSGITATGTAVAPLSNIKVRQLRVTGLAGTTPGVTAETCGHGIDFKFCNDCEATGNYVTGWSDAGISSIDGNRNIIWGNNVKYTAQNIQVAAQTIDCYDNMIVNNISGVTLLYTGIQTEGNFGGSGDKKVYGTVIFGNNARGAWERGIVSQVSPNTVISGNYVGECGVGLVSDAKKSGIHLYGAPNSSLTGNVSVDNPGYGIRLGANSTSVAVSGNTTQGNDLGSLLLTDDGVATSYYVAMGINSFAEGDITISGNASILNRTMGFQFTNTAVSDATTLDYYKEDEFTPVVVGLTGAGTGTYTAQVGKYTRIGNVVHFWIRLGWSAHDGTGALTITGLPFTSSSRLTYPVSIRNSGLAISAGNVLQGTVGQGETVISLSQYTPATGVFAAVPMDSEVDAIDISGTYPV